MKRSFFLLACIIMIFPVLKISAQSLPDFSGVWVQDKDKSDDFYKNFNVQSTIIQTKQTFTVKTTFSDEKGQEMVTRESTFSLDGKEITNEKGAKLSAIWSDDRKNLTTSDTKNYGGDVVGVTASYSISDNKNVLTVKTADIKPGGLNITQIFNRKQ